MMQEGRNMEDMQKFDYLSYGILRDPGRSEEQRHLRAGSHYTSDYGSPTGVAPAKLVFYAHCEVEPLRTLRLIDDISDVPIGLCYMGAFLNPRLYCEIAAVNANARKILTFDGDVNIDSTNADDIASELVQILTDSVASAERQIAATERLAEQRQVAARHNPVPKGAARPKAEPLYRGYAQAEWDAYNGTIRLPVFASRVGCLESLPPVLITGALHDSIFRVCFGHARLPYTVFYKCSLRHKQISLIARGNLEPVYDIRLSWKHGEGGVDFTLPPHVLLLSLAILLRVHPSSSPRRLKGPPGLT